MTRAPAAITPSGLTPEEEGALLAAHLLGGGTAQRLCEPEGTRVREALPWWRGLSRPARAAHLAAALAPRLAPGSWADVVRNEPPEWVLALVPLLPPEARTAVLAEVEARAPGARPLPLPPDLLPALLRAAIPPSTDEV